MQKMTHLLTRIPVLWGILGQLELGPPLVSRFFLDVSSLTFPFLQMLMLQQSIGSLTRET